MSDSRVAVLTEVARLYTELVDPLNGPSSLRGDGDSVIGMPATYTPTVREYERLVKLMRDDRSEPLVRLEDGSKVSVRSLWWHLEHWHHRAERVIRHVPLTHVNKKGHKVRVMDVNDKPVLVPALGYRRDAKAQVARAELALEWVARRWGLVTEPMLPQAVVEGYRVAA